jgi:hypothetical protein
MFDYDVQPDPRPERCEYCGCKADYSKAGTFEDEFFCAECAMTEYENYYDEENDGDFETIFTEL